MIASNVVRKHTKKLRISKSHTKTIPQTNSTQPDKSKLKGMYNYKNGQLMNVLNLRESQKQFQQSKFQYYRHFQTDKEITMNKKLNKFEKYENK